MKTLSRVHGSADSQKKLIVIGLYLFAGAIAFSGAFFCIYSYLNSVSFRVLNVSVPGLVFGVAVIYFGIRGILSVNTLRPQLFRDDARFSWNNFRRQKTAKSR